LAWSKREREEVSFKDCFLGHFLKTAVFKKKKQKKTNNGLVTRELWLRRIALPKLLLDERGGEIEHAQ
jgi:hypothetical protein